MHADVITNGFGYLAMVSQASDGGFQYQNPYGTDPNSTGLGLQALAAYGWTPRGLVWSTRIADGTSSRLPTYNPLDTLMGLQESEGSFPGYDKLSATCQAVPGIAGKAFPFRMFWIYLPTVMRAL